MSFASEDGLTVTAELYAGPDEPQTPLFVLFHQARSSRGEYREIAPRLVDAKSAALAVDLRSGGEMAGVVNETHRRAVEAGKDTAYVDALADMRAALRWAREKHGDAGPIIGVGSSYSASLLLRIAADEPALVDAVIAFSPGEYFDDKGWIAEAAKRVRKPLFITGTRDEAKVFVPMLRSAPARTKAFYVPESEGVHGARALSGDTEEAELYWDAMAAFLIGYFD